MDIQIPKVVEIDAETEQLKARLAILRRLRSVAVAAEASDQANDEESEVPISESSRGS